MGRLQDKVAIITGAAGGIGKVTAEKFLKEGAKVVLVDMNQESLDEVKSSLNREDKDVLTVTADVTKEADVENYVNETIQKFNKIDVFFNNAGIEGKVAPLIDQDITDFDKVINVNVRGIFLGLKYVLPSMIKQESGSIINTSSVAGLEGSPGVSPYITSKHAVVGLTKAAAVEVASNNVRVNSIHPSPVNTRMMRSLEEGMHTDEQALAKTIPMGRYGESEDIANLVLFLASDESTFITGSQYRIDGGMAAM